jgi:hypothetical protein
MPMNRLQTDAILALSEAQETAIAMIGLRGYRAESARVQTLSRLREERFSWIVRKAWRRAVLPPSAVETRACPAM